MLEIFTLDTEEKKKYYKSLLSSLKFVEPYNLLDYIDVFSNGIKKLICFNFSKENHSKKILMLGYLNPIAINNNKANYYDFITPYGYTGPQFSSGIIDSDIK